jgi:hypothetical protein
MPGVGGAVTNTVSTGLASGGPLLAGGPTAGVGSTVPMCELPHKYFTKQGKSIMIEGWGVYSLGTTIPTLTFAIYLDSTIGTPGTKLAGTGAFTVDTTSRAAMSFNFRAIVTATAVGPNGSLQAGGWLNWGMVPSLTTTLAAPQISYSLNAGTTTPVSFNTDQTTPVYIEPYAFWSTSSTGPSITLTQMYLWGLN